MVTKTFPARVANGRLQYDESLAAFEGQQVHITLLASEPPQRTRSTGERLLDEAAPEGMDVEKDIYVPMALTGEVLRNPVVLEGGPLKPCLVIPEELPDE